MCVYTQQEQLFGPVECSLTPPPSSPPSSGYDSLCRYQDYADKFTVDLQFLYWNRLNLIKSKNYFFFFQPTQALGFITFFIIQYYSVICRPQDYTVWRPRAEIRTRDVRSTEERTLTTINHYISLTNILLRFSGFVTIFRAI